MLRAMSSPPASGSSATTPEKIAQKSETELLIRWADGVESTFQVRALRLACGCAACIDEWTGENTLDPESVPADIHPVKIEPVGRYAIQIDWSDGHVTGIYPFERLRALDDALTTTQQPAQRTRTGEPT